MGSFFKKLGQSLADLFTSKKFLTAAAGAGLAIAQGAPAGVTILGAASAYVVGQGMADFGKNAAAKP